MEVFLPTAHIPQATNKNNYVRYHAEGLVSTSQLVACTQARHTTLVVVSFVNVQTSTQKWDKSIVRVLFIVGALHPPPFDLAVNTGGSNERNATKRKENGERTES